MLLLGHLVLVKQMEMVVVLVKGKLAILFEMKQYLLLAVLLLWLVAEALIILCRMADGLDYVQYWHMRELLLVRLVMDSDLVMETEEILPVQIPANTIPLVLNTINITR